MKDSFIAEDGCKTARDGLLQLEEMTQNDYFHAARKGKLLVLECTLLKALKDHKSTTRKVSEKAAKSISSVITFIATGALQITSDDIFAPLLALAKEKNEAVSVEAEP